MAIFSKWRGPDLGDQSTCPRAGLPLRLEKRAGRNLIELSKENQKVLQALARTEGWELPGWGENKFPKSQPCAPAAKDSSILGNTNRSMARGGREAIIPLYSALVQFCPFRHKRGIDHPEQVQQSHHDGCGVKHLLWGRRDRAGSVWRRDTRPQSLQRAPWERDWALHSSATGIN